ncbi:protein phosphatase 2C domain-containing protein [Nocardia salmonicida]|uniref:PP2C family protein-serine/threonine phosphatase n=1 Tax=Nocardia salmonicida TaxID=53431 RepID=UPI003658AB63
MRFRRTALAAIGWVLLVSTAVILAGRVPWVVEHLRLLLIAGLSSAPLVLRFRVPKWFVAREVVIPGRSPVEGPPVVADETSSGNRMSMSQSMNGPVRVLAQQIAAHGDRSSDRRHPHTPEPRPDRTPPSADRAQPPAAVHTPLPPRDDTRSPVADRTQPPAPAPGQDVAPARIPPGDFHRIPPSEAPTVSPWDSRAAADLHFVFGASSRRGRRQRNEDAWLAEHFVLGVADGAGGRPHGREASRDALSAAAEALSEPGSTLAQAVQAAITRVTSDAVNDSRHRATTLDLVMIDSDGEVNGAHIGDSRVLLLRTGSDGVEQVTTDHSAGPHLTRSIGGDPGSARPDMWVRTLGAGDRLVVASDGVWSRLSDPDVDRLIAATAHLAPEEAATQLTEAALAGGGTDNVTVIVADVAGSIGTAVPG